MFPEPRLVKRDKLYANIKFYKSLEDKGVPGAGEADMGQFEMMISFETEKKKKKLKQHNEDGGTQIQTQSSRI